jgi:dihydroxy-acid dehydratase
VIDIDARPVARRISVELSDAELAERLAVLPPRPSPVRGGLLEKYRAQVGAAHLGAVTHSGPG